MIKCIMFDIGGVLMHDFNKEYYCQHLSKLSGLRESSVMRIINGRETSLGYMGMITKDEMEARMAERLGIGQGQVKWYDTYEKHASVNRPMLLLARRLHRRYTTAYLSNIDRSRYHYTLKLFGQYLKAFDYRFASFAIGMQKPYNAIYSYTLQRLRLRAEEVIFIDNELRNVRGAREVGMRSLLFTGIASLEKELRGIFGYSNLPE